MPKRALANASRNWSGFFDPTRVELEKAGVELVMADFKTAEELVALAREHQVEAIYESAVHVTKDALAAKLAPT